MFIIIIISLTLYFILDLMLNKFFNLLLLKNHIIEIIWTLIPIFILLVICYLSLKILYFIDEIFNPYFSLKAIGHQWYWSYEYPEFNNYEINCYINNYLNINQFRLLETDNRLIIPFKISLRLIVSSVETSRCCTSMKFEVVKFSVIAEWKELTSDWKPTWHSCVSSFC